MMTVRFPNGHAVVYNTANWIDRDATAWRLYESNGGRWIASIMLSAGVIVESVAACSVRDDAHPREVIRTAWRTRPRVRLPKNFAEVVDVLARGGKPRRVKR